MGWQNVSAYGIGTMGYTTTNLDRIGTQGIRFTDHYAQPSFTAGHLENVVLASADPGAGAFFATIPRVTETRLIA